MKLMIIIVRDSDGDNVIRELVKKEYRVTRMSSTGGFLRHGNVTLLVGAEEERVDPVMEVLRQSCCPPEAGQHRATVFVVDMPYSAKI